MIMVGLGGIKRAKNGKRNSKGRFIYNKNIISHYDIDKK